MVPPRLDFVRRAPHAEAINFPISRQRADYHGERILAAAAVDDIGEQESLALVLLDAADELPAHERMQLRVLVHGAVNGQQQAPLVERCEMLVQVEVAAVFFGHLPGERPHPRNQLRAASRCNFYK